jgi:hypothetical protein
MFKKFLEIELRRVGIILLAIITACSGVAAQNPFAASIVETDRLVPSQGNSSTPQTDEEKAQAAAAAKPTPTPTPSATPKKEKRGSFVIAPIPISSPTFGSGLILALGYVFKLKMDDKLSPPSTIGVVGAFTNSGSGGLGLGGRLYFSENKYQTTFMVANGHAVFDFFGIGRIPGRDPVKVPINGGGKIFFGEFMRNFGKSIFIGPRFQYRKLNIRLNGIQTPGGFVIPDIDLKSTSAALGFHVQRDKRDSTFYPRKGSLFDFTGDFFDQAFGSRRQYQTYKIAYNGYREVASKQVFAYRAMACSANGSVPFYDLCLYGFGADIRGYTGGEFQNRRMFAMQGEYRLELPKRFGVVGFGGLGGVARDWNDFRSDGLLPAAGVGLRFVLDKKNHINYRIDFAYGREGHTLSIGVGEAF